MAKYAAYSIGIAYDSVGNASRVNARMIFCFYFFNIFRLFFGNEAHRRLKDGRSGRWPFEVYTQQHLDAGSIDYRYSGISSHVLWSAESIAG